MVKKISIPKLTLLTLSLIPAQITISSQGQFPTLEEAHGGHTEPPRRHQRPKPKPTPAAQQVETDPTAPRTSEQPTREEQIAKEIQELKKVFTTEEYTPQALKALIESKMPTPPTSPTAAQGSSLLSWFGTSNTPTVATLLAQRATSPEERKDKVNKLLEAVRQEDKKAIREHQRAMSSRLQERREVVATIIAECQHLAATGQDLTPELKLLIEHANATVSQEDFAAKDLISRQRQLRNTTAGVFSKLLGANSAAHFGADDHVTAEPLSPRSYEEHLRTLETPR